MSLPFGTLRDHLTALYPGDRFFGGLAAVAVCSALGFWFPPLYALAIGLLLLLVAAAVYDGVRLAAAAGRVDGRRRPPAHFSLGDPLEVIVTLTNDAAHALQVTVLDELPEQLQLRDHQLTTTVGAGKRVALRYPVRPLTRGVYRFGDLNVYLSTPLRLLEYRRRVGQEQAVPVYPSISGLRKLALRGPSVVEAGGRRRPRPVTRSYEFDQIKEYVRGDDLRNVNWKATARRGEVMVNTYAAERAQRIYAFVDKGRTMLMPFGGLSLLDHAINAALALTKVVLSRGDRAGLLTFSDKLGDLLPADGKPEQLRRALETLYRQQEREGESDYDLLYYAARRMLPGRSLIVLFTNFESAYALERVLPTLRRIARVHSLVVVLFENTEVAELLEEPTPDLAAVYRKHTARRYLQERQLMATQLRRNGIKVVLTRPEDLTPATVGAYLELKGRGI